MDPYADLPPPRAGGRAARARSTYIALSAQHRREIARALVGLARFGPVGLHDATWKALCAGRLERLSVADYRLVCAWFPQVRRCLRL